MQEHDTGLNLYLVQLKENDEYHFKDGFYTGFVVCCESIEAAKLIHPSGQYEFTDKGWKFIITKKARQSTMYCPKNTTWIEPYEIDRLDAKFIGKASTEYANSQVIITSFNELVLQHEEYIEERIMKDCPFCKNKI